MIIDTDVLIWYMRGNNKAHTIIMKQKGFYISVVTYIELVQGMNNKKELLELRCALREWNTKILYLNEEISIKAMFYVEKHFLSGSLMLPDALIASTALVNGLPLLTGDNRHFKTIKELDVIAFKP